MVMTVKELLEDPIGAIDLEIARERRVKRHAMIRGVALCIGAWTAIYIFCRGLLAVLQ